MGHLDRLARDGLALRLDVAHELAGGAAGEVELHLGDARRACDNDQNTLKCTKTYLKHLYIHLNIFFRHPKIHGYRQILTANSVSVELHYLRTGEATASALALWTQRTSPSSVPSSV